MSVGKHNHSSPITSPTKAKKDVLECVLKPLEAEHQTLRLKAGANILGRNRSTGIRDGHCSKRQIELNLDLVAGTIGMKVLGVNPSCVNGLMLMQHSECALQHGDVLEFIYGRHAFEVVFTPPPKNANTAPETPIVVGEAAIGSWDSVENGKMVVYTSAGVRASTKVAAYDMDGTIIKTKSGNVFPKSMEDWELAYSNVSSKLKSLHETGYKICFFTNQAGIARGKVKLDDFKKKVLNILRKLGVPVQVFIAIANGYYRKPLPGMWEHLRDHKNGDLQLQLGMCFYVGDAAGRPELGSGATKRRKDHSLADRLFASNVGISFYTPEEHFLNKNTENWTKPAFEPNSLHHKMPLLEPTKAKLMESNREMILMVGLPGSGKSHFVKEYLEPLGYVAGNADILGSSKACLTTCEKALISGQSCVVDNTNVDAETRKKFIKLAERLEVPCRCFVMSTTLAHAKHNLAFRELTDDSHSKINDMVFNTLKKKYKAPTLDEGFQEIVTVNLKPKFNGAQEERLYKLYLVEK